MGRCDAATPFSFGSEDVAKKRAVQKDSAAKMPGEEHPAVQSKRPQAQAERAVSEKAGAAAGQVEAGATKRAKKERPVRCIHRHADVEFRREFRKVCKGLIEKAAAGGVGQTRLLLDIGRFGDAKAAKQRRAKSLSALLLEELKRRQDEREAALDNAELSEAREMAIGETCAATRSSEMRSTAICSEGAASANDAQER